MVLPASITRLLLLGAGVLYPAYRSFQALEGRSAPSKDEAELARRRWLTYWVVFAAVQVGELAEGVVSWLPAFREAKLGLVLFLLHPRSRGAESVYNIVLRPWLRKHEPVVDAALGSASARALAYSDDLHVRGREYAERALTRATSHVAEQLQEQLRQRGGEGEGGSGSGSAAAQGAPPQAVPPQRPAPT